MTTTVSEPQSAPGLQPTLAVVTTVATEADARRIAVAVVERGLAACVQMNAIDSVYTWQGAVQQEREVRLLFKVGKDGYEPLERAILELHPYELPAVFALPVSHAHAPYARWVYENSRGAAAR